MKKIILEQCNKFYIIKTLEPLDCSLLAGFLTDDVGSWGDQFITYFEDPTNDSGSHNYTAYLIDEGIVTFIPEWEPDFDECIAKGYYFQIRRDLLLQILRKWAVLYKEKPQYITITIADDSVTVIGSEKLES